MKKAFLKLLLVSITAALPVVYLLAAYLIRQSKVSFDFERTFPYRISDVSAFNLKHNSYYIAGIVDSSVLLGNLTTRAILHLNSELTDTQRLYIDLTACQLSDKGDYRVLIESNRFYLLNGVGRSILRGQLHEWKAENYNIASPFFHAAIPVGDQSFIYKYISVNTNENAIRKETLNDGRIDKEKILQKHVDGRFCTSGHLLFNKDLNAVIYLYAYRNELLVMDTNLNVVKKLKTIDPIDSAKFQVSRINSSGSTVLSSPTITVNHKCATWRHFLFVNSGVMARNEDEVQFKHSNVIDIYDLKRGVYMYSFYLPKTGSHQISDLNVVDNFVYTISNTTISRYAIRLPRNGDSLFSD